MKKIKKHFVRACAWIMAVVLLCGIFMFPVLADNNQYGLNAYSYLTTLTQNFKNRVPGSEGCINAGEWISSVLSGFGYQVEKYQFETTAYYADYCVTKQGVSNETIYIAASYDSTDTIEGIGNGSGVSVLLELAQRFADTDTYYTIKFWFLGASEEPAANEGARSLMEELIIPQGVQNTAIAYINLDDIAGGDNLYVYGGAYENNVLRRAWLSQMALDIASRMGIDLQTIPQDTEEEQDIHSPEYLQGDVSYFNNQKIAYVTFSSGVWENGEKITSALPAFADGAGLLAGTELDQMTNLEAVVPGRMQYQMSAVSMIVSQMLREMNNDNLRSYGAEYVVGETEPETEETFEETIEETETISEETTEEFSSEVDSDKDGVLYNPFANTDKKETLGQISASDQSVRTGDAASSENTEFTQHRVQENSSFARLFEVVMGIILTSITVAVVLIIIILKH